MAQSRRTIIKAGAAAATLSAMGRSANAQDAKPIASTKAGKVRGSVEDGVKVFKGVRYGADTATTRFQAPKPPQPWRDIRDALDFGAQAPQPAGGEAGGLFRSWANRRPDSEDCLFLNVWTPGVADKKQRPVMVWLHGGGFTSGSGASNGYDGVRLAKRGDVVVITINHRLNLFGHLYLADYSPEFADSGNAGVLDIVLALEWVRDNAAAFGGDPGNVMIFGESGGGAKVSTLMAMDAAKGLFHRAAVQSGAWLTVNKPEVQAKHTATVVEALGLTKETIGDIRTVPFAKIQAAARPAGFSVASGPVLDGKTLTRHPFTPDGPPQSKDVPLLIGLNRTESTLLVGGMNPALFDLTWETLPAKLTPLLPGVDVPEIIAEYRRLHPSFTASDLFFAATTDSRFLRGHVAQADRKAEQGGGEVFFYMLDWDTPVDGGKWRAPHALEIGFVFDNVAKSESMSGVGPDQQRIADLMSESWLAFARSGNPNNKLVPTWPAYQPATRAAMIFNLEPKVVEDPHGQERRLFDALPLGQTG